jgi:uncharacterized protein (TIGR00299 family) protein
MSRLAFVDVIGGAAGDMLLAALIDAGAPEDAVRAAIEAALPGRFAVRTEDVRRAGLRARWLRVEAIAGTPPPPGPPRSMSDLVGAVDAAPLGAGIKAAARSVLERLGRAEAAVHGVAPAELHLHELGDDDTILDVVGVATALDSLGVEELLVSPLPLAFGGSAPARGGHGEIPLPAAVALELLKGFELRGARRGEERVTPTAAAVFAAVGRPARALPDMTLESVGYGAGTRDPEDRPNVVRVLLGSETPTEDIPAERSLELLQANLDDLTPELVADAAEALLEAGALDAWTTPAQMKKGRPGSVLSALCDPERVPALRAVFFRTTSTFGVRSSPVRRAELERHVVSVPVTGGAVRVKVGLLAGRVVSAKPEHDDVAELARATGRPVRELHEEAAAAARATALAEAGEPR